MGGGADPDEGLRTLSGVTSTVVATCPLALPMRFPLYSMNLRRRDTSP